MSTLRIILLTLLLPFQVISQGGETIIQGSITDNESKEMLSFVDVSCLDEYATTDEAGKFTLSFPKKDTLVHIYFDLIGYQYDSLKINLSKSQTINFELSSGVELSTIIVTADNTKSKVESTQMSKDVVTMEEAKLLPALFGEVDIIKTVQLKPGISSAGEGSSGITVRGGATDQNLFLFDGTPVYNPSHLFGFFSTFNSDAIKKASIFKGGFPAEYGGRLSSVLDLEQLKGSKDTFNVQGGIGLISSRLTVSGPIKKGKTSFLVGGRRTYFDLFTRAINSSREENNKKLDEGEEQKELLPNYFFHDLNGALEHIINDKNRLSASAYWGEDEIEFKGDGLSLNFDWGNLVTNLKWIRYNTDNWSMTNSLSTSRYKYNIKNQVSDFDFELGSTINDYQFNSDHRIDISENNYLKFGINTILQDFKIGTFDAGSDDGTFDLSTGEKRKAYGFNAYISDKATVSDKITIEGGVRFASTYSKEDKKYYPKLEPRFALNYSLNKKSALKFNYTLMHQFTHLIKSSDAGLPTDIWFPSTKNVKPQQAQQVAIGYSRSIGDNYYLGNEVYYKQYKNQVDFKDFANLFVNTDFEREFVYGKGHSYGNEIYLEKTKGKLTGWVGYTLAVTKRKFDDINGGKSYFPKYHKLHDFSIVALYKLSDRVNLSATWVFSSGSYISIPEGKYTYQDFETGEIKTVPKYSDRGEFKQPNYHRLDLGVVWKFTPKWGESDLTFSVYNAYSQKNPYFIFFEDSNQAVDSDDENIPNYTNLNVNNNYKGKQQSLFPIIPSITYNFKF